MALAAAGAALARRGAAVTTDDDVRAWVDEEGCGSRGVCTGALHFDSVAEFYIWQRPRELLLIFL
jgi:hypothetical protein